MHDEGQLNIIRWGYAGPVAKAYELNRAPVSMIVGPVGGGKTTASVRRYFRVATWQQPSPRDGKRKAKILTIAPTYRRLHDQILPSYREVLGHVGEFRGSRGDPVDHSFELPVSLNGKTEIISLEVLFRAVNDMAIEDFMRGFLFTAIHLPEADTNGDLAQILSIGATRVGRYPEPADRPEDGAPGWEGIFGDANAPVIGSAFHDIFYRRVLPISGDPAPATHRLFRQPSGLSPRAENMAALRRIRADYYGNMKGQLDPYDVGRMIECKPGFGRHGMPVHPDFDEDEHVAAAAIEVDRFSDVLIGVDAGSNTLKPAATFSQRTYSGQWRKLAEIYLPDGVQMGTQEFGYELRRILDTRCKGAKGACIGIDPAALGRNASSEFSTAQELQHQTQIEVLPAPSNQPKFRRSATARLLRTSVGMKQPAIVIDPSCIGLIQGYVGGFHYPKRKAAPALGPAKNSYSHVCEADEYAHLTFEGLGPSEGRFIRPGGEDGNDAPVPIYD